MNTYRKIANDNHEEAGALTTRHTSRHGLSRAQSKVKRIEARDAMKEAG